jgi:hypothetical protein
MFLWILVFGVGFLLDISVLMWIGGIVLAYKIYLGVRYGDWDVHGGSVKYGYGPGECMPPSPKK